MIADAVILPARETVRDAIMLARATPHRADCRLYTDGRRVAWLPQAIPGWFRLAATEVLDEYEKTDALAGCCDIGRCA